MTIHRYFHKEVFAALAAVTTLLVLIFLSNEFVHYLKSAAEGELPIGIVLKMMLIAIPYLVGILLPLGFFMGILLAFGRMYVDSEMTVLTACGMSRFTLVKVTFFQALVVAIVVGMLSFWINPTLAAYTQKLKASAVNTSSLIKTVFPGRFRALSDGKQVYYVGEVARDREHMQNIFLAQQVTEANQTGLGQNSSANKTPESNDNNSKKEESWDIMSSEGGHLYVDPKTGDEFLVAENGNAYRGQPGTTDFRVAKFEELGIRVQQKINPDSDLNVTAMSTEALWKISSQNIKAAAELQMRASLPLQVFLLGLLAVPLSRTKPRSGKFMQLLPGILIYVLYSNMLFVAHDWVENGSVSKYIGVWWLHASLLLAALGIYALQTPWRYHIEQWRANRANKKGARQ